MVQQVSVVVLHWWFDWLHPSSLLVRVLLVVLVFIVWELERCLLNESASHLISHQMMARLTACWLPSLAVIVVIDEGVIGVSGSCWLVFVSMNRSLLNDSMLSSILCQMAARPMGCCLPLSTFIIIIVGGVISVSGSCFLVGARL